MKYGFKAGLLITLSVSLAPLAANAYPGSAQVPQSGQAVAPILKAGCYYGGCWHRGWDSWRPRYSDFYRRPDYDWHPRYGCGDGCGRDYYEHSRYYSHYRWGSYHRFSRPCDPCGWDD
ncbi:MAG: hypothetical protein ACLPJW_15530 [Rhodomicrobium sp.]